MITNMEVDPTPRAPTIEFHPVSCIARSYYKS